MPNTEVNHIDRIHEVFSQFEPALIESLIDNSIIKSYDANEAIIRTGQFMPSTVLVLEGRVKVYRESDDGSEFFLYYLTPGQACAVSMSCAARMESSQITAIAMESTKLIMFPVQTMNDWMKSYRSWYEFVISTYSREVISRLLKKMEQRNMLVLHRNHIEINGNWITRV